MDFTVTEDIETTEYDEIGKPGGPDSITLTDSESGQTALSLSSDGQSLDVDWDLVEVISNQFKADDFSVVHAIARALVLARRYNFADSDVARCDHDWQDAAFETPEGGPPICAKCGLTDRRIG